MTYQERPARAASTSSSITSRRSCWSYRTLRSLILRTVRSSTRHRTASSTNRDRSPCLPPLRARKMRTTRSVSSEMERFHRVTSQVFRTQARTQSAYRVPIRTVNFLPAGGSRAFTVASRDEAQYQPSRGRSRIHWTRTRARKASSHGPAWSRRPLRLLRTMELADDYAAAWTECGDDDDTRAWDLSSGDGFERLISAKPVRRGDISMVDFSVPAGAEAGMLSPQP